MTDSRDCKTLKIKNDNNNNNKLCVYKMIRHKMPEAKVGT